MKLVLIRPRPENETIGLQHVMIVEPLELEILGATIRKNDSAVIVDMIIEKGTIEHFLSLHKPDVLGITGYHLLPIWFDCFVDPRNQLL